jgi:hypothetical protein
MLSATVSSWPSSLNGLECRLSRRAGAGANAAQCPACHGEAHHRQDGEYCGRTKATRAPAGGLCYAVCADDDGGIGAGARRPLSAGRRRMAGGASCPWYPRANARTPTGKSRRSPMWHHPQPLQALLTLAMAQTAVAHWPPGRHPPVLRHLCQEYGYAYGPCHEPAPSGA